MKEEEGSLIYEEEIVPNISTHAVRAMGDGIEDVCVVRRMLDILTHHPFDTDRIQHNNKLINSFFLLNQFNHFIFRRQQDDIPGMRRD